MRSGMRSWSKCVIFSRRMKSFSSAGPRSPALSEFWLSATATPWFVVRRCPVPSTRTRSSGATVGFWPGAAGAPVLSERLPSASVLAPTRSDGGCTWAPSGGATALSRPCSAALFALKGIAATVASVSAACWEGRSPVLDFGAFDAALSEARAAALPATVFLEEGRLEAAIEQLARVGEAQNYAALSEAGIIAMALIFSHAPPTSCVRSSRCA